MSKYAVVLGGLQIVVMAQMARDILLVTCGTLRAIGVIWDICPSHSNNTLSADTVPKRVFASEKRRESTQRSCDLPELYS